MSAIPRKHLIAAAVAIALGVPAYATAQQGQPMSFEDADRNKDGAIDKKEAQALNIDSDRFSQADKNNDQRLGRDELTQIQAQQEQQGAVAQQGQEGQTGARINVEQAQPQVQVQQPAPKVIVQQPEPKITVQQPEPKITVQQPEPNVTVQQSEPKVEVTSPEPQVTVEQAKPQVQVTEPGQPEVQVQKGQSEAQVEQPGQGDRQQAQTQGGSQPQLNEQLMSMSISEIEGMTVQNRNGDNLGDIEQVVVDRDTNRPYAIVSVGGFLGMGEKQIAMELDQMELADQDRLTAPISMTEDELTNRPAYNEGDYRELQDNQTLASVLGTGGAGQGMASFSQLDRNGDGYIGQDELQQLPDQSQRWQAFDSDSDQRLDQSEFSALEQSAGQNR